MAVFLQTSFKIIGVQSEMLGIFGGHRLQIGKIMYAVHHVAMKPKKNGKGKRESYPHRRPCASLFERNHMGFSVDNKHVEHKNGGYENHKTAEK